MIDVSEWLRALGLEQYEPAFRQNEIDGDLLPRLTSDDLKDLGVSLVGHRRRLLEAAAALRRGTSEAPPRAEGAPARSERNGAPGTTTEQRRQITVMFCDLVGSTALACRLDPEDLRDVIATYQQCVAEVVARFDGFVARCMGDGVLVYFGYPRAHEDDPDRSVRAALAIIDAVGALPTVEKLHVRIGIGTGLVIVYDLLSSGEWQERSIVGQTPNLAARLQALAEPDTVVIGINTRRLLGDLFEFVDLGSVQVKGFDEPVRAFQVIRPSAVESRFEALHGERLSPLIGRQEEIELLLRRWQQAKTGEGKVVLLSGEPGIGKSHITAALRERIGVEPHVCLRYFCSPYHQDSALHPFIAQLERAAGFAAADDAATRWEKLRAMLARAAPTEEQAAHITLLLLPDDGNRLGEMSPEARKEHTLGALLAQIEGLAAAQPVLVIFEDIHWIDPTSLELLTLLVERAQRLKLLLIATARPNFIAPWVGSAHVMILSLTRLDRRESVVLTARVTAGKTLPDEVLEQILARSDGVPLFVEELTKAVLENGLLKETEGRYVLTGTLPPFAIPTTLNASLMSRLDRMEPARELAQIAAVIGREFSEDLVRAVAQWPENEIEEAMSELVSAQLVLRHGTGRPAIYSFKHALVQDAAYDTLLRGKRQTLHARIAEILETRFPDMVARQPELLAQHLARAGARQRAIGLWLMAARQMMARGAVAEAVRQLHRALELLTDIPEGSERQLLELDLQIALGSAMIAANGYTAPETDKAYARARELCETLGESSQFLRVVWGQFTSRFAGGNHRSALVAAEEQLALSERIGDAGDRVIGRASRGSALLHLGALESARAELAQAIRIDAPGERERTFLYGQSGRVLALAYLSLDLLLLGFPDQAQHHIGRALAEADELSHPTTLCFAHSIATRIQQIRRDAEGVVKHAGMVMQLANEQGLGLWQALGEIYLGWTEVNAGRERDGIEQMRHGLARYRARGARLSMPQYLISLACAHGRIGDELEAHHLVLDAMRESDAGGEGWMDAEIHRVAAELLLSSSRRNEAQAETELTKAVALAQQQGAKLWQLRAATSLARLWSEQGRHGQARQLLAPIHGWFREGLDRPDLQEAQTLLGLL